MAILPDIVLDLPAGWERQEGNESPLTVVGAAGALQISSPQGLAAWRGADPELHIRQFVGGALGGRVTSVERGLLNYGPFVRAECIIDGHRDAATWMILPDTHDPLLVTWLGDSADEGRVARDVVARVAPGIFSAGVNMVVSVARGNIATHGGLDYHAVFICDGTVVTATFGGMPDEIEREGMRLETKRHSATVAARVGMAQVPTDGGDVLVGFVYAESRQRRKRFLIPVEQRGQLVHEVGSDGLPICDFFVEPDPQIAAALENARSSR
jgi:hypothetical protein